MRRRVCFLFLMVLVACGTPEAADLAGKSADSAAQDAPATPEDPITEAPTATTSTLSTPTTSVARGRTCGPFPPRRAAVVALESDGRIRWTTALRANDWDSQAAPLVDSASVYSNEGGEVRGLELETGRERWRLDVGGPVYSAWLVGATIVAVVDQVSPNARVIGVDSAKGVLRWEWRAPGYGLLGEQILLDDGALIMITATGELKSLNTADGSINWSAPGGQSADLDATPDLVLRAQDGTLIAHDARSGQIRWKRKFDPQGEPLVVGEVVVSEPNLIPHPEPIRAYRLQDGQPRWEYALTEDPSHEHATSAGLLIRFGDHWAMIDPASGKEMWRSPTRGMDGGPIPPLVVNDELVTVEGAAPDQPKVIVRRDGKIVTTTPLDVLWVQAMIPRDGGGVIVTGGKSASRGFAAAVQHGKVDWSTELPEPPARPPAPLPDGGVVTQVITVRSACAN